MPIVSDQPEACLVKKKIFLNAYGHKRAEREDILKKKKNLNRFNFPDSLLRFLKKGPIYIFVMVTAPPPQKKRVKIHLSSTTFKLDYFYYVNRKIF